MEAGNSIRLLILEESSHEAEMLAIALRNAGYAVRSSHIEDGDDLAKALNEQHWDLFLAAEKVGDFGASKAMLDIKQAGKDIPTIVLLDNFNADAAVGYLTSGAAACVPRNKHAFLLAIIPRELDNLRERRAHRECRAMYTESEKRNRSLLGSSRDAIAYIHEGMHIYANQSYLDLFGYDNSDELESIPIMDLIASEAQSGFKDLLRALGKGETPNDAMEFQMVNNSGETFAATMEFSQANIEGEPCTQVIIRQRTADSEIQKELEKLRQQDLLTGLLNRQYFMQQLGDIISQTTRGERTCALLYLEPDNFKSIKDTLGIGGSDLVLTDLANLLRQHTRSTDILARYAGTIFTAIVDMPNAADVEGVVNGLREVIRKHVFEVEGKSVTTTCSVGVVHLTETSPDIKQVISLAENACTAARGTRGDGMHVYSEADLLASQEENRGWIDRIHRAIKDNAFRLVYQPIVSLHAEPSETYEVLLRMVGANGEDVLPGEFLPAAEQAQLMPEIDRWVLKNAAKALVDQRRDGKATRLFVKVSVDSIKDPTLLPWISKLLKAARLHGASFVFVASESAVMQHLKETKAFVSGLKQLHCEFALNQVGSDDPNLGYLSHLDCNYLKVSGALISDIAKSPENQEMVKKIAELARGRGMQTIAEHVQDPNCLAILWQCGVNFIQGFYLQTPTAKLDYDFTAE